MRRTILLFFALVFLISPACGSIFDVLSCSFVDNGIRCQNGNILPSVGYQDKGRISGYVDIVGFRDMIIVDGEQYIPGNPKEYAIVLYDAEKNNNLGKWAWWSRSVDWITKDLSVTSTDEYTTATLTVRMKWHHTTVNSLTKKRHKTYYHETATFTDSIKNPKMFTSLIPSDAPCEITEYNNTICNHSLVRVPVYDETVKTVFHYGNESVTRYSMIGEVESNEQGVEYVNFTTFKKWDIPEGSSLSRINDCLYIPGKFKQDDLDVMIYGPYTNMAVYNYSYSIVDWAPEKTWFPGFWLVLSTVSVFFVGICLNLKSLRF